MPSVSSREPTKTEIILDLIDQYAFFRYRHVTGPAFVACLCFALAALASRLGAGFPFLLTVITLLIVGLGWESVLRQPDRAECLYAGTCWIWAGVWTILAGWFGPTAGELPLLRSWFGWSIAPLIALWVMGLALLMPPWVRHRRVRRAVDISKNVMAWDGDAVGLPFTRLSHAGAKGDEDSWSAPIDCRVKGMYTLSKLRDATERIAARYKVGVSDVEIFPTDEDEDGNHKEGKYFLRIRQTPRPKGGAPYPVPASRPDITAPFRIGDRNDDVTKPLLCELFRPGHGGIHSLTVGTTGYGKTTLFRQLCLHAIAAHNCLLFLGDMKPGCPDYLGISRGAYVFAMDHREIDLMVHALLILCRVRGATNHKGAGGIPLSQRMPIFVEVDETALYFRDEPRTQAGNSPDARREKAELNDRARNRINRWEDFVMVCRGYGINIFAAAQRGKEANVGKDARSQLLGGQVVGFFSPKPADSSLVSPEDAFELWTLKRGVKGQCKIHNMMHPDVASGQLYSVPEDVVEQVLDLYADGQGDLMPDEIEALERELGDDWRLLRERTAGPVTIQGEIVQPVVLDQAPEVSADPTAELPQRHSSADNSREAAYRVLVQLGRPATAREVGREIGRGDSLTGKRLRELVRDGRVRRDGEDGSYTYSAITGK